MLTKMYDLAFSVEGDDIELEQDLGSGEVHRISMHRIHLRHLAELAGLIPQSAYENPDAVIARLARQLRTLHHRIDTLDDWLRQIQERGRDDVGEECAYSFASWELSSEFVNDLSSLIPHTPSKDVASRINHPENGTVAVANGPKSGGVAKAKAPEIGCVQAELLGEDRR